jgi:prepilin-type N-terminal cleavage/methylation domain-containing protein
MRRIAGFTLIEVVVALALAAGSIGALLTVFDDSAIRTDRAVLSRLALLQAQSALDTAGSGPLIPGWRVNGAGEGLAWEAAVFEHGDTEPPLRRLVAAVWQLGPDGPIGEPLVQLQTLRLARGVANAAR